MFNLNPALTPAQVKSLLMSSGTKVTGLADTCGCIVNFYAALVAAGYKPPAPVSVSVSKKGKGTVKDSQGHISCGKRCSYANYTAQGTLTLKATPAKGYAFKSWSGSCSGKKTVCMLAAGATYKAKATFVKRKKK